MSKKYNYVITIHKDGIQREFVSSDDIQDIFDREKSIISELPPGVLVITKELSPHGYGCSQFTELHTTTNLDE